MPGTEGAALSWGQHGHRRRECSEQLQELQRLEGSSVTNPRRINPMDTRQAQPQSQRHSHGFPASEFPSMAALQCATAKCQHQTKPQRKARALTASANIWLGNMKNVCHQFKSRRQTGGTYSRGASVESAELVKSLDLLRIQHRL